MKSLKVLKMLNQWCSQAYILLKTKIMKNFGLLWKNFSLMMRHWFLPLKALRALGFGFRCGFLGMLHLEIIQERLEREFDMTVITTVPNVSYHAYTKKHIDQAIIVNNPSDLPDPSGLDRVEEPYIKASIITKADFVGNVMSLCIEKRGVITNQTYLTPERVELNFDMPLAEIVFDFYDRLKNRF